MLLAYAVWFLDPLRYAAEPALILLNALPLWLLAIALFAISRRVLLPTLSMLALVAALQAINGRKLAELELPLMPSDSAVLPHLFEVGDLYLRYVDISGWWLLALPAAWLLFRVEPPFLRKQAPRALLLGSALTGCASLAAGLPPWSTLYDSLAPPLEPWVPLHSARAQGSVAFFVRMLWSDVMTLPEPDRARLADFQRRHAVPLRARSERRGGGPLPDIVVLQSEAFFDPGLLNGIDSATHLPHLMALRLDHEHGELVVPAIGGLTSRTEFEVLTGIALEALPGVQYPYQRLVTRPMRALPNLLRRLGYRTIAVHPYDPRFYNRHKAFPLFGFERFHSIGEFHSTDQHGFFVADAVLGRRVQALAAESGPQFVFAVSMENHGPWTPDQPIPGHDLAQIAVPEALDENAAGQLRLYLHHLQRADAAIGALAAWALAREDPTVLLVYGDHLPALPEVYGLLGFVDGREPAQQTVPWLLLDNRRSGRGPGKSAPVLHSYHLGGVLLDAAGIATGEHFGVLDLLAELGDNLSPAEHAAVRDDLARTRVVQDFDAVAGPEERRESIVSIDTWGPVSVEADPKREGTLPAFWVRAQAPIPRSIRIRLAGTELETHFDSERVAIGVMRRSDVTDWLTVAGPLALDLYDVASHRLQHVGSVEVRPKAERVSLAFGRRAAALCPVVAWGPERVSRSSRGNLQPDGGEGLWIRAGCLPDRLQIELGAQRLPAVVAGGVATLSIPSAMLLHGDRIEIALIDESNSERLAVGVMRIEP